MTRTYNRGTPAERFAKRLAPVESGCIEYQGYRQTMGYGRFGISASTTVLAHRFAWELAHGPVPAGMWVLHKCDNPPCCNVDHLFVGTATDNNQDMWQKRRGCIPHLRGERANNVKLTEANVLEIRRLYVPRKVTSRELAERFGVSVATIRAILARRNWGHLA